MDIGENTAAEGGGQGKSDEGGELHFATSVPTPLICILLYFAAGDSIRD